MTKTVRLWPQRTHSTRTRKSHRTHRNGPLTELRRLTLIEPNSLGFDQRRPQPLGRGAVVCTASTAFARAISTAQRDSSQAGGHVPRSSGNTTVMGPHTIDTERHTERTRSTRRGLQVLVEVALLAVVLNSSQSWCGLRPRRFRSLATRSRSLPVATSRPRPGVPGRVPMLPRSVVHPLLPNIVARAPTTRAIAADPRHA